MLLNNQQMTEEIKKEIKICIEMNENENTTPQNNEFYLFSSAQGTFSRIDHILAHRSSLGKFKTIEIIPSVFSDHNAVRLDLNYRRKNI